MKRNCSIDLGVLPLQEWYGRDQRPLDYGVVPRFLTHSTQSGSTNITRRMAAAEINDQSVALG